MFVILRKVASMRNSKEILVLIILIFVVLISSARAEEGGGEKRDSSILTLEQEQIAPNQERPVKLDWLVKKDAPIGIGVLSASSVTNDPDDLGLVLTLTKEF